MRILSIEELRLVVVEVALLVFGEEAEGVVGPIWCRYVWNCMEMDSLNFEVIS